MQGDSGNPLVFYGNTVLGVANHANAYCDDTKSPGVYARVTSFIPFINDAMSDIRTPDMRVAEYKEKKIFRMFSKSVDLVEI